MTQSKLAKLNTLGLLRPQAAGGAWSPADLASLVSWGDASDETTLYVDAGSTLVSADGQKVYRVADKSGNSNYIQQTSSDRQSTYEVAEQNGLSVLSFDAPDRYNIASLTLGAFTEIIALKSTIGSGDNLFEHNTSGWGTNGHVVSLNTDEIAHAASSVRDRVYFGNTVSDGTWHIVVARCNGTAASMNFYVDGVEGTRNVNMNNGSGISELTLDFRTALLGLYGEHMIFNGYLSAEDVNGAGAYLADKWDLSWTDIS